MGTDVIQRLSCDLPRLCAVPHGSSPEAGRGDRVGMEDGPECPLSWGGIGHRTAS